MSFFRGIKVMNLKKLLALGLFLLMNLDVSAACVCRCINGEMKPICQSSLDLPPICPPTICPLTPPSITPLQPPTLPPLGTRNCTQQQRLNYVEWEKTSDERKKLIDTVLAPVFKDLQFDTGGQISIDIYPKGTGKEQILKQITGPVHFFGDRICEGGNDRSLAIASLSIPGSSVTYVKKWTQTQQTIRGIVYYGN